MVEVLLIHGSCYGAWAWDKLIPALGTLGIRARALDLPGRNGEPTTLKTQAKAVVDALTGPTVLLGHSAGGYVISAAAELAAELAPNRVTGLIYLCAYIPQLGLSLADMRRAGPSQPLKGAIDVTPDRSAYRFDPARSAALFFHDCPDPDPFIARMGAEPILPQETALPSLHRCTALPRAAIICTDDRAIPPDYQRHMAQGLPQTVLASGHSPFLSMPDTLAREIDGCLRAICATSPPPPQGGTGHT